MTFFCDEGCAFSPISSKSFKGQKMQMFLTHMFFFRKPLGFLKKVPLSPDFLVAGDEKSLR